MQLIYGSYPTQKHELDGTDQEYTDLSDLCDLSALEDPGNELKCEWPVHHLFEMCSI